jgi:hypothetical protein
VAGNLTFTVAVVLAWAWISAVSVHYYGTVEERG